MNDLLNALQMIMLPFALIPVLTFACSRRVMHDFRMGVYVRCAPSACRRAFRVSLSVAAAGALAINMYFLFDYVQSTLPDKWYYWAGTGTMAVVYLGFIAYLVCNVLEARLQ